MMILEWSSDQTNVQQSKSIGKLVEMEQVILTDLEGSEKSALEEDGEYRYLGT